MAPVVIESPIFPLFSSLPPELRNQVWRDALPDKVGTGLYFYRKGCWCPRRLTESDEEFDPENDGLNLSFEFRHDLLDDIQFEIPLFFVNREARSIALAWIREQGIAIRPRSEDNGQYPVFVRPFDPMRDALYVALDQWDDFIREPYDRLFEPDLFYRIVDVRTEVTRVAVPEALLRSEADTLPDMLEHFFRLEVLFVIADAPPDLRPPVDYDGKVQQRWEFESAQGGAFLWNDDRRGFDFGGGEYMGVYEPLYRLIELVNEGFTEELARNHMHSLEVRLAVAMRK